MEDSLSTTNYNNKALCSISKREFSPDSSWSLYIDGSLASSGIDSSSICSEPESSVVYTVNELVASARSIAKRRKTKAYFIDHDLEDTASSPVCSFKDQKLEEFHTKYQGTNDYLSNLLPTQIGELNSNSYSKEKRNTNNQIGEIMHSNFDWKEISYTKLREKGLCLVPVSMLFNFP